MRKKFDYTALANRYTARSPMLTYVGTQINFWILANILLVTVLNLYTLIIGQVFELPLIGSFSSMLWVAVILGILYGVSLGAAGYYLERNVFKKVSLGRVILFKALGSLVLLIFILWLLRYVFFYFWIAQSLHFSSTALNEESWEYLFYLLLVYYSFMTLAISFINQMNNKYGPGVLVPLLLGKYRDPKEQERIFMFMDLKSSTTTAERLGHLLYSAFIRDCFADINEMIFPFQAQVYQYVGDEIVVTWPLREGLKDQNCIRFYFACKEKFHNRIEYYSKNYGFLPEFKAGMHMGKVTVVEIGEIKKDIAYHGDTLNTAARIQGICKHYNEDFIVSEYVIEKIGSDINIKTRALGEILLRGKAQKIGIVSVEEIDCKNKSADFN
jgi:adenylate cyclase